jgi:hypothetical protein
VKLGSRKIYVHLSIVNIKIRWCLLSHFPSPLHKWARLTGLLNDKQGHACIVGAQMEQSSGKLVFDNRYLTVRSYLGLTSFAF